MKKNYLDFWKKGLTLGGMLMFAAFSTFAYEVKVEAEDAFDFYHSGTAVKVDTPAERQRLQVVLLWLIWQVITPLLLS